MKAKIIVVGTVFGLWTVKTVYKISGGYRYLCLCKCGIEQIISGTTLRGNYTNSCKKCSSERISASIQAIHDERFMQYQNQKYNSWTILWRVKSPSGKRGLYCWARCQCSTESIVSLHNIIHGKSTKCRSCNDNRGLILNGTIYGNWTVLELDDIHDNFGQRRYICRCACGKQSSITASDLKKGNSTQCVSCHISKKNLKHGYTYRGQKNSTYGVWAGMKDRCLNINHKNYDDYGGRGIKICDSWKDFANFIKDMGLRPEGLQIDRIDPDGDYEPKNCRWVTAAENKANRRISKKYKGQYVTVKKSLLCDSCLDNTLKRSKT